MCLSLFPEPLDIPRNALNSAASSLRWNRANGQLPFSNWIAISVSRQRLPYCRTELFSHRPEGNMWQTGRKSCALSAWKKQTSVNKKYYVIAQTMTVHCYKVPLWPPHDRVHLDDIKKRVATIQHDIKSSRYFVACGVGSDVSKAPRSFTMSGNPCPMTRRHIAEDINCQRKSCDNRESPTNFKVKNV